MVLLKFLAKFFYCTLLLSFNAVADNTTNKDLISFSEKIQIIHYNLLELGTQLDIAALIPNQMGMDIFDITIEAQDIRNQLLYFEYQLGTPHGNDQQWNISEEMFLNAKKKLKVLEEKIKFEGNWGKVGLKLDPKEQYQKIDFKYNYGF